MDTLTCDLDGRSFQALLGGLCKMLFYGDKTITAAYLAEQLYGSFELTEAESTAQITAFEELLQRAAHGDWDPSKLEDVAKGGNISPEHSKILVLFWTGERQKVHAKIIDKSTFSDQLKHAFWRVDVKVASRAHAELNEPVAVVELNTRNSTRNTAAANSAQSVVRFDMGRDEMSGLLKTLESVQKKIDELGN